MKYKSYFHSKNSRSKDIKVSRITLIFRHTQFVLPRRKFKRFKRSKKANSLNNTINNCLRSTKNLQRFPALQFRRKDTCRQHKSHQKRYKSWK